MVAHRAHLAFILFIGVDDFRNKCVIESAHTLMWLLLGASPGRLIDLQQHHIVEATKISSFGLIDIYRRNHLLEVLRERPMKMIIFYEINFNS